jgi:hypothetical protein
MVQWLVQRVPIFLKNVGVDCRVEKLAEFTAWAFGTGLEFGPGIQGVPKCLFIREAI